MLVACDIDVSFLFCSEDQSRLAARKYARVVQKLGFPVSSLIQENTALFFIMQKPLFVGEKIRLCEDHGSFAQYFSVTRPCCRESDSYGMSIAGKVYRIQNPEHGR